MGIRASVWSSKSNHNGLGTPVLELNPIGEWRIDAEMALSTLNAIPRNNTVAVIYEGGINALQVAAFLTRNGIRVIFNFLSSHELVQMRLLQLMHETTGLEGLCTATSSLSKHGVVFTGDTKTASLRLRQIGFSIADQFPIFSAIEPLEDFSTSNFDIGLLNPTSRQILLFSFHLLAARISGSKVRAKALSQNPISKTMHRLLTLLDVSVSVGKFSGHSYLEAIGCQRWILDSRRTHHVFGSSGQYLDLLANKAQVFSFRYTAMSELGPAQWSSAAPISNAFRALRKGSPLLAAKVLTASESLGKLLALAGNTRASDQIPGFETAISKGFAVTRQERATLRFRLILRALYRLPRRSLYRKSTWFWRV